MLFSDNQDVLPEIQKADAEVQAVAGRFLIYFWKILKLTFAFLQII